MSKSYVYPPPEDHARDVLCVQFGSVPCRIPAYMVQMFNLPVDLCGIDWGQVYLPEVLELNPIHSVPFLIAYDDEGNKTGVNGSASIVSYLIEKFRDLIPDTFFPKDLLKQAKISEKVNYISDVVYRATMYQYVYPLMGLMTECQYDLCKRDFALDQVEGWASKNAGDFFEGEAVSLADIHMYSLFLGNSCTSDDKFKGKLPWRHCDVLDKYPATKKLIEAVGAIEAVKTLNDVSLQAGDIMIPSANQFATSGAGGFCSTTWPGNARKFKQEGDMLHPNAVMMGNGKDVYDMPRTVE
eukprot:m.64366 g.64366  ORF g.64366 m.64366 type:complete len:297 (-) comp15876_c0_seq1:199-1089(-)